MNFSKTPSSILNILAVDDEVDILATITQSIKKLGHTITTESSPQKALQLYKENDFQLVISDLKMKSMTGLEMIQRMQEEGKKTEFIVITAFTSYESAVTALKFGVFDYLEKPFTPDELRLVIRNIDEKISLSQENIFLKNKVKVLTKQQKLIGKSSSILSIKNLIQRISLSDTTVLITGESGTGKEVVANEIHRQSSREDHDFVARNLAAIPETLMESEFFGHEPGAFTDAKSIKIGSFEQANGGTIFLDEIGEMPLNLQAKLLRVLETKEIQRLGGTETIHSDFRVIAATNQNLEKLVAQKKFREDLFYRLNIMEINIPPLRERKEDIPLLAHHFIQYYQSQYGKNNVSISKDALLNLTDQSWNGNVRELKNALERAILLMDNDVLQMKDFDFLKNHPSEDIKSDTLKGIVPLKDYENAYIRRVLNHFNGNRTKTADALRIGIATLWRKLGKRN
jgi:DNA-binding NtrC family response regulator